MLAVLGEDAVISAGWLLRLSEANCHQYFAGWRALLTPSQDIASEPSRAHATHQDEAPYCQVVLATLDGVISRYPTIVVVCMAARLAVWLCLAPEGLSSSALEFWSPSTCMVPGLTVS